MLFRFQIDDGEADSGDGSSGLAGKTKTIVIGLATKNDFFEW